MSARRAYSLKLSQRVLYLFLAAVLVGLAVSISSAGADPVLLATASLLAFMGLNLALLALRTRLTLDAAVTEIASLIARDATAVLIGIER